MRGFGRRGKQELVSHPPEPCEGLQGLLVSKATLKQASGFLCLSHFADSSRPRTTEGQPTGSAETCSAEAKPKSKGRRRADVHLKSI